MASRTAEGKHTTRFIIEVKGYEGLVWTRSDNDGLRGSSLREKKRRAASGNAEQGLQEVLVSEFARSKATSYARQWLSATFRTRVQIPAGPP